jgi:tetratricopeptide (TPR) repeat protein
MKQSDIPYNMSFSYGDDLREVPEDSEQMRKGLDWLQDKIVELAPEDTKKSAVLLSMIGGYARIMGDLDLSEKCYHDAIKAFEELKATEQVFAAKLRLAVTYQFQKKYSKSTEIFEKAIKIMRSSKSPAVRNYLDFALQHFGKQKFEQGFYAEAMDLFMEALEQRIVKGDLELISSTELAINKTKDKLEGMKA